MTPTEPEEERLRAALRAVVPEAPTVDPAPAARARRRGPVVAVLAVAATVVAIAVVPPLLGGTGDHDAPEEGRRAAAPTSATPAFTRSVNPYRDSCPTVLPSLARAPRELPDLSSVRSVRLCADPDWPLDDPADALVSAGVDDLAAAVAALGPPDDARCATISRVAIDTSLAFVLDSGEVVTVPSDFCTDVRRAPMDGVPATRVDAAEVTAAFLAALDTQRQTTSYFPLYDAEVPPLACDTPTTQAPVRPTDGVSGGLKLCVGPAARPVQVPTAGKDVLLDALGVTPEPATTGGLGGYDDEMPYLLYRTDRSDVVRLSPTEAGLLLDGWQVGPGLSRSTVVPLDMSDVTDP